MNAITSSLRIGIYGPEESTEYESRGCSLWPVGYAAAVTAAGATPVLLGERIPDRPWKDLLGELDGLVWTGSASTSGQAKPEEEKLCSWCRKNALPLLAVDTAMHALNVVHGGTLHLDLPTERPEALQHRHPPETGLRHAIAVVPGTHIERIYGEGEIVVNSEHRRAIAKAARGFCVSAQALDGIVEAIEAEGEKWFALGVQWRPASATASGLDIQVFRGLLGAAERRLATTPKRDRAACTSAA
jgi:putative glutamine amidotransferase